MKLSVVILAAGKGRRMLSDIPKPLHKLAGLSLLERVVNTAKAVQPERIYVVYGHSGNIVKDTLQGIDVTWVEQKERLGTGHAVLQAVPEIPEDHKVLILYGDVPLISENTLRDLLDTSKEGMGVITSEFEDPNELGRIVRDHSGNFKAIVEFKDADEKTKKIREVNSGIYVVPAKYLKKWLPTLSNNNTQKEYYLTDILGMAVEHGIAVSTVLPGNNEEILGVNDRLQLVELERYIQFEQAKQLLAQGVTIMDPYRIDIRGELNSEKDVTIDVNTIFEGSVTLGSGTVIHSNVTIKNSVIGRNVSILPNCFVENAVIEDGAVVGPFARLRPDSHIKASAKVGNFVEIKKSVVGEGSKVGHLTYIGDAVIGKDVNVGAGTITCNYDGVRKHHTQIDDGAFIGSGTQLVAPVSVGKGAYIGAGSTITSDAKPKKLTLSRADQRCIESWKPPVKVEEEE
ncbi:MAG: bifunctional UDP-N-acetylglucosamine diphosphorylase/glucosamine-1-phosphate N-acetyltransferase GlmU [Gammaproteobacteria bacterium]